MKQDLTAIRGDEEYLDTSGLTCPLPVLRARKRLMAMAPGSVLRVIATDPVSVLDMPHFCREAGHDFLGHSEKNGIYEFHLRRGDPAQGTK